MEGRTFKAELVILGNGETRQDVLDLVNINDPTDRIMAGEFEFTTGEIVNEGDFILYECKYVDDQGYHTGTFAFKKLGYIESVNKDDYYIHNESDEFEKVYTVKRTDKRNMSISFPTFEAAADYINTLNQNKEDET